jgi:hypothetical protein
LNSVPGGTGPVLPGTGVNFGPEGKAEFPPGTALAVPGGTRAVPPGTQFQKELGSSVPTGTAGNEGMCIYKYLCS